MSALLSKYITIHSVAALHRREYSIIVANIPNTPEKSIIVKNLYPDPDWYLEYHDIKHIMKWVIG